MKRQIVRTDERPGGRFASRSLGLAFAALAAGLNPGTAWAGPTKIIAEAPRQRALVWVAQAPPELRDSAIRLTEALDRASQATTNVTWRHVPRGSYVDDMLRTCPVPTLLQCFASVLRRPQIRAESGLMLVLRVDAQTKGPVLTGVVVVAQDVEAARTIAGIRKGAASAELEDQIFESATRLGKLVASQRSSDALASYLINDVLAPHLRAIGAWKPNGTLEVDFGRCAGCTVQADGRTARSLAPGERARFERVPAGSHRIEVSLAGRSLALCPVDIEAAKQTRLSIDACAKTSNAMEKDRVLTWV
ncbi:MAG: hypothetical protein AAFV29_05260, partial [Myxococcota bacterium]